MASASNLGFPRIGPKRELKKALEGYWSGKRSEKVLLAIGAELRQANWLIQKEAGLQEIPSNDFSFYDHVLDTAAMVGAVPARYNWTGGQVDLKTYFAMARGHQDKALGIDVPAMEMTKWFDTNYHYIVPEFEADQKFKLSSTKIVDEFIEAKKQDIKTRPVLLGPVSFLLLGKSRDATLNPITLLESLLPVYEEVFKKLASAGAEWIQIDEPFLSMDLAPEALSAFQSAYSRLSDATGSLKILVATYFEGMRENLSTALRLPISALHLDLVRAPDQLDRALEEAPESLSLSLGVVDGRNIWCNDLNKTMDMLETAEKVLGSDRLIIAPSCSLLYVPIDLDAETEMDDELKSWLAFAKQKVQEVVTLTKALKNGRDSVAAAFEVNQAAMGTRASSGRIHNDHVKQRVKSIKSSLMERKSPYAERKKKQQERIGLPQFPTTTIGSFPQTSEVRAARSEYKSGKRTLGNYEKYLRAETEKAIQFQEELGLDLLVHGEFERNDMVEYFGEQLDGFGFTQHGWVQSYGSRCVKPPFIFGDVERAESMTVDWSSYAQSLTDKPVKGMLTGPVTILQWSFVRNDQPHSVTCQQIALAIRDEVVDLEDAGIKVVQIDEPAFREGLPLRKSDWNAYMKWAVNCFKLSAAGVEDETQIQTHMCYSEFNDIMSSIANMDADVILIETSRSQMELLDVFKKFQYPNEIGPGIYDIHSQRVPATEEMAALLRKALEVLKPEQLWVNPDCGLKTRSWDEVRAALTNMVAAAKGIRTTAKTEKAGKA
jgi:5-methyltetrahydropteroyltriglutamate--homocysteine methyltransferase